MRRCNWGLSLDPPMSRVEALCIPLVATLIDDSVWVPCAQCGRVARSARSAA